MVEANTHVDGDEDGFFGGSGVVERCVVSYEALDDRFILSKRSYTQQYAQLYFCRLLKLREDTVAACRERWKDLKEDAFAQRVLRASEASEEEDRESSKRQRGHEEGISSDQVVVGIVFRSLALKPSILKEYARIGADMIPMPPSTDVVSYVGTEAGTTDGDDSVVLEDESGRVRLEFSKCEGQARFMVDLLVTGLVVGARGQFGRNGVFVVADICAVGVAPKRSISSDLVPTEDRLVCLISGLSIGDPEENSLARDMLMELLKSNLGNVENQTWGASIVRTILAGKVAFVTEEKYLESVKELDTFLTSLASSMPVDLIPGENDPTNYLLPQQPFNKCMMPSASRFETLRRAPNPYEAAIGGRCFLGTSGQNITDCTRYSPPDAQWSTDRLLDLMENLLRHRHISPTAPDTLGTYPFYESDPFGLDHQPDVFFAGNQREFATRVSHDGGSMTRLICIPDFATTKQAVLVNLRNLECDVVDFVIDFDAL